MEVPPQSGLIGFAERASLFEAHRCRDLLGQKLFCQEHAGFWGGRAWALLAGC